MIWNPSTKLCQKYSVLRPPDLIRNNEMFNHEWTLIDTNKMSPRVGKNTICKK